MIPFLSASGTSPHPTKIEVEVVSFSVKGSGAALGPEVVIKSAISQV